ncbi:MAG: phosphoenolpyruvate synthase [Actinobacteria bacterium]|nr:phosphoenolpyruvate synthase [Actinomycetota bacterium]
MGSFTMGFEDVDRTGTAAVGGKGVGLGELSRVPDVVVPDGFCVTTDAFRRALDGLDLEGSADEVRAAIEAVAIPEEVAAAIVASLARLGDETPCAVRSSATAEDLPSTSFAGQGDTYLDLRGTEAILDGVRRCWASLFAERAVAYRRRNRFDDRAVAMAVVVQRMVSPTTAGTLFTADPLTGNRKVSSIEAVRGLGEALVSGQVNADGYKVRGGRVVEATAVEEPVLTEARAIELAALGRRIEAHLGRPQDIEWCLDDDGFQIVQSRSITTLFPIPAAADDANRVYVSVGHQQMMTDPMKPLGLSLWQMTAARPMHEAGGRLFVEVTRELGSMAGRAGHLATLGRSDPLIRDALGTILERGFVPEIPDEDPTKVPLAGGAAATIETDPAIVAELIERNQASLATLKREIEGRSGAALFDFIRADIEVGKERLFDPRGLQVIMAGMQAAWWLNERLEEWLGERNAADTLAQSAPGNVTAEMGLALLDVADAIRPHPEVVMFLERVEEDEGDRDGFLDELPTLAGGEAARAVIEEFLATYGMRCVGEIDITRPRWAERPTTLVPIILGNVRNFEAGAGPRRFERGREEAARKERDVVARLRALPDGEEKAAQTERMVERLRAFAGYREYPKYGKVSRDFVYKRAVMREAERLAEAGVLTAPEDAFFLRFEELAAAVRDGRADADLIRRRKEEFRAYEALTPPRVLTSEGETLFGSYRREGAPAGALLGQPVSTGTIEGRARVVRDISRADLEPGDILVTRFTDPSWTPLFVAISGLITEVGGLMTHGAVIAREYGLPAIVGVENATELIEDGRRIRLDGTDGYVELLD